MPKCKNCNAKMPKGFSYCGSCGADMVTGMIPWTKKTDNTTTPKEQPANNASKTVPKVSMTPSQNIDAFINNNNTTNVEPIKPVQPTPIIPPQQKFNPVQTVQSIPVTQPQQKLNSVQTIQTATAVATKPIPVASPQQKFNPIQTATKVEPIKSVQPIPVVIPQQQFNPVQTVQTIKTDTQPATKVEPIQPIPVVIPQQQFNPVQTVQTIQTATTVATKVEPIKPVQPTPIAPSQQQFNPFQTVQTATVSTNTAEPINNIQSVNVSNQPQKPAYIPKPAPNTAPIEMVKVPDITNRNQDDARTQLENLGFKVTIEVENSSVVRQNVVISQSIRTGTEVTKGSEIKLIVSVGSWTDWSVERIVDTNMYIVEQKKEFRFRSRTREIETHESSERNLPGYTCIDQRKVYSDWEDEGYYTTEDRPTSETCDISTNLIGFKYCGYSYTGSDLNIDMCYSTKQSALIFNPNTKPEDWQYIETVLYQDIPSETIDWYFNDDMERVTPAGDNIDCNIKMTSYFVDGKRYAMKYGSLGTEWFLYHKRTEIETVYTYKREYFTDWSDWSNWTDKAPIQDELNEVEARILYRGRRKTSKELSK